MKVEKKKVFIVHGRDNRTKDEVACFISSLGMEPIVLQEQLNKGRSLLEKFEEVAREVSFAVVLYTPCDIGKRKYTKELKCRARQNVVFEHGFFEAILGSERVFPLRKDNVELPGDISGLMYIPMDEKWKDSLKKELREASLLPPNLKLEDAFITQEDLDEILKS